MLVFPQLVTGASALYPVTRRSIQRTVVNTLGDGSTVVFADPDAAAAQWELHASGMRLAEWNAIQALFLATSGMWQTFTFLDPAGNLLSDSETLSGGAWTNGGLIELTSAVAETIFTPWKPAEPSAGAASTSISVSPNVPLIDRPGPLQGSAGSLSNSSRTAVMPLASAWTAKSVVCLVGA